jgi:uncharacterized membrane protein
LQSIDFVRGIAMAFMALDHVRDFLTNLRFAPEDLSRTYPALFLTRWVTHFSAPAFFFLAGTGAFLYGRKRTLAAVSHFLWTRGLFLIAMEFTVIHWGWTLTVGYTQLRLLVIWALGACMVCLSQLIKLPTKLLVIFAVVTIAGHNLLDLISPDTLGAFRGLFMVLHHSGGGHLGPLGVFVLYPLVPWVGVMAGGYAFGTVFTWKAAKRRKFMFALGGCAIALFILLRATNLYGNAAVGAGASAPGPFVAQATFEKSMIAFLNVEKYPPALDFLLMTLGPTLLVLAVTDSWDFKGMFGKLMQPFIVIGKVPMFYYTVHLYVIHAIAIALGVAFHQPWQWLLNAAYGAAPSGYGQDLPIIWGVWLFVVALLYLPCRWYAQYKATHKAWWLSYI